MKTSKAILLALSASLVTFFACSVVFAPQARNTAAGGARYVPTTINFAEIPGSFAERVKFLETTEPRDGYLGYPSVVGITEAVKSAPLGEIAKISPTFFHRREQPVTTCITKIVLLGVVADRVLAGEKVGAADAKSLVDILATAPSVAEALKAVTAVEQSRGGLVKATLDNVNDFVARANRASEKLHQS